MCNTGGYRTHVLYVQNMCIIHVSSINVKHLYFYTCNTPTTAHMYYRGRITSHVLMERGSDQSTISTLQTLYAPYYLPLNELVYLNMKIILKVILIFYKAQFSNAGSSLDPKCKLK